MISFSDFSVWGWFNVLAVLLASLLLANALKKAIPFLKASLIPVSVIGGLILVVIAGVYKTITGNILFDTAFFGNNGTNVLEQITYHTLALGFIASAFKSGHGKLSKRRTRDIFNTGVTTVATYLLQGIVGMGITLLAAYLMSDFFKAAGLLLPFGYGQGTGQAMNYGNIYQEQYHFAGGKSFGLTIAAFGFISASFGGVIHLNILRRKGKLADKYVDEEGEIYSEQIQADGEIPMQESIDKMTVQIALIALAYMLSFVMMFGLAKLLPGMAATIFGFNFLLGVLAATVIKVVINMMKKAKIVKKEYTNDFLMTRVGNFFFDIMVVAGIAAIRLGDVEAYWGILVILGVAGLVVTYAYNLFVAKVLFKRYPQAQFLAMFGMLTGTASTGIILLREIDGEFKTPAADNLVYQTFPAIVFGFPMMLLATLAPQKPILTYIILVAFFLVMNVILFRRFIFPRRRKR